jgi:hypothetical protein
MKINKPEGVKLICLTPVVNEAFELDRFLQSASAWADYIILGYQESMDNTLKIANSYEKVIVVNSPNKDWNELVMRSLLYDEARKIPAVKRIILNLDADEVISANYMTSSEWKSILNLPEGSIFRMPWANLQPSMFDYVPSNMIEVGFVDDGKSTLSGSVMHMGRVPWPNYDIKIMQCTELKLLHYAFVNTERNHSKKRWYQGYEKVGKSEFGPHVFRKYNRRRKPGFPLKYDVNLDWFSGYQELGIDVTSVHYAYDYSHDYRMLEYFDTLGTDYFRMCNVWDKDWVQFATGKKENPERFRDPRNKVEKLIHRYIYWSIFTERNGWKNFAVTLTDKMLRLCGYSNK